MINELNYLLESKKGRKLGTRLSKAVRMREMPLQEIYDIVGTLMLKDTDFFLEKVYPAFRLTLRKVPYDQIQDMDRYILQKFCLFEGEQILTSFLGIIREKKVNSNGNIFLTNYRIILSGNQTVQSAQKGVGRHSGLIGGIARGSVTRKRKNIRKSINQAFRQEISAQNCGEWGYIFPIVKAFNIKRKKNNISYNIVVETDKKPIRMSITVSPTRNKKGQTKEEFLAKKEEILSQINGLLNDYAKY